VQTMQRIDANGTGGFRCESPAYEVSAPRGTGAFPYLCNLTAI